MDQQEKPYDAVNVMNSIALTAGAAALALIGAWAVSVLILSLERAS